MHSFCRIRTKCLLGNAEQQKKQNPFPCKKCYETTQLQTNFTEYFRSIIAVNYLVLTCVRNRGRVSRRVASGTGSRQKPRNHPSNSFLLEIELHLLRG